MLIVFAAAAVALAAPQGPGRAPGLLHRDSVRIAAEKDREQEAALRSMLALGGAADDQAEALTRLAALLRGRGLSLSIQAAQEADAGDAAGAQRDRALAAEARADAIARFKELLQRYPGARRTDEALFFLADALQDSGRDDEALSAARELVRRFPRSAYAPASHVFIGEHLFDQARLADALGEYRAAAQVPGDEVYAYALYKAAWCRFNQNAFADALTLLHRVVAVSLGGDATAAPPPGADANKVQLAREARRDYVLVYGRVGRPEGARTEFVRKFGREPGEHMLELYGKLLFDQGRDPEAQAILRQLMADGGSGSKSALAQTRLLMIAQRGGKRRDVLREAHALVEVFQRARRTPLASEEQRESLEEANRLGEDTLRTLAIQLHNEAKKTDLDETWSAAHALYGDYLALFGDSPSAYDLRFFDAELLYARGEKARAAALYESVVRSDVDALRRKASPGRWLAKAAWSAVLARDESLGHEGSGVKDGGSARSDARKTAQRPLGPGEQELLKSCLLYLEALPKGPHAVEVAFKAGRLEYVSNQLDAAEKHLSWVALEHPEHELAEYAANLVLDVANLRKDPRAVHAWAVRFLHGDPRLLAHGTVRADLQRVEEESAYALADTASADAGKAESLLAYAAAHPRGELSERALFGAAAALSRAGRIDDALAARARLLREAPASALVPRALLASAADRAAVGDLGESAGLLEQYARGYRRQVDVARWRREHGGRTPKQPGPTFDEEKARAGLHDAAVLREARNELRLALADRLLLQTLWPKDDPEERFQLALLRSRTGEITQAARELTALARSAHKPDLSLRAWHEAARLFGRLRETGNEQWSWTELEKGYRALGPKGRERLSADAVLAAAEAHHALGGAQFEKFRQQQIRPPLMVTLNRKVALLQAVKKRAEETVAYRQAGPAVCALGQLGEAQWLLGAAIANSPSPNGLNADQRRLYRAAVQERAQPLYDAARETLKTAEARVRELGVSGSCASRVTALVAKAGGKPEAKPVLDAPPAPISPVPAFVDGAGASLEQEPLVTPAERKPVLPVLTAPSLLRTPAASAPTAAAGPAQPALDNTTDADGEGEDEP